MKRFKLFRLNWERNESGYYFYKLAFFVIESEYMDIFKVFEFHASCDWWEMDMFNCCIFRNQIDKDGYYINITRWIYFVVNRKKVDEVVESRNKKINKILK